MLGIYGPQELIHPSQILNIVFKPSTHNNSQSIITDNQSYFGSSQYHQFTDPRQLHLRMPELDINERRRRVLQVDAASGLPHLLLTQQQRFRRAPAEQPTTTTSAIDMEEVRSNITRTLNSLLRGYDRDLRPGFMEGKPLQINVSINVRNLGPVSEQDMDYVFDCYLRQRWRDERLIFGQIGQQKLSFFTLDAGILKQIWKPNTYFHNGALSHMHTITRENIFIRLYPDGSLYCSMRLTVRAKCPMSLHNFPHDVQTCPLIFGSFSYPDDQIIYNWIGKDDAIQFADNVQMAQFYLSTYRQGNCTAKFMSDHGHHALLLIEWQLKRQMGYFFLQTYLPCTLIVILSWVAFWLNREATSDRVTLGITSFLTLSTIGIDSRKDLPKMSHGTALDWFLILCYTYVSGSLIIFCIVHYFTKVNNSGEEPVILQLTRQHQASKHRRKIRQLLVREHKQEIQHQRRRAKSAGGGTNAGETVLKTGGHWSAASAARSADPLASETTKSTLPPTSPPPTIFHRRKSMDSAMMHNNFVNKNHKNNPPRIVPNHTDDDDDENDDDDDDNSLVVANHVAVLDSSSVTIGVPIHHHQPSTPPIGPGAVGDPFYDEEHSDDGMLWYRDVYGRQCRVPATSSAGRMLGIANQRQPLATTHMATGNATRHRRGRKPSVLETQNSAGTVQSIDGALQNVQIYAPERRVSLLEQGESIVRRCFFCIVGNEQFRWRQATRRKHNESHNNVSMVDRISRCVFPLSFVLILFLYWRVFTDDDHLSDDANRAWQGFMNCSVDEAKKYTKNQ